MSEPDPSSPQTSQNDKGAEIPPATTESGQPSSSVRLRAGDAERHRTAAVLQEALGRGQLSLAEFEQRTTSVWSAVYRDELEPLTADLVEPPAGGPTSYPATALDTSAAAGRITGGDGPAFSMAIWSRFSRKGTWTVPHQFTGFTLMGGGELDLRHADFATREVTITAVAIMGGIEIIVPDDIHVRVVGIGFMGAFDDGRKWDDGTPPHPSPDAPIVTINGLALMGGVEVRRTPRR